MRGILRDIPVDGFDYTANEPVENTIGDPQMLGIIIAIAAAVVVVTILLIRRAKKKGGD